METLVAAVLKDLHHSLDRLADELEVDRPRLARMLRAEVDDPGCARPLRLEQRGLRPLLYRALDEGALDARKFDRLMTLEARARRTAR